jgi:hypothetical protein
MISLDTVVAYVKTNWMLFVPYVLAFLSSMTVSRTDCESMKKLKRPRYTAF